MSALVPLGSLLAHHAARDPARAAVILDDTAVGYGALDARANRRARMLAARGVRQGDFVTLALPNSLEFYETSFAIWKLGAIPNVVSPKLPQREIDSIVALVKPSLVVGLEAGAAAVPAGLPLDEALSAEPPPPLISPHWKAMTSGGSTGQPKIIVDALPGARDPTAIGYNQQPGDIVLNPGPLYHNAPFLSVHYALFAGATVVEMLKFDPLQALALIQRHRVTWVNMVPTMMSRIWRLGPDERSRHDMSSLRAIMHMAAPCPAWLKQGWIDWLGAERVFELYGGTERLGSTVISGPEWLQRRGSVGRLLPGSSVRVLDEAGATCPPGTVGEIFFLPEGGPGSTYRYIGSTARRVGKWESLGDLGWCDADGYLYLSDRRTDLIISGGANIYPGEVEAALEAHPDVQSSIVIGLPDEDWGERVHAIVQRRPGAGLDADALTAFAAGQLARYKLPKSIEFTAQPLRDEAGKVRRATLRAARLVPPPHSPEQGNHS